MALYVRGALLIKNNELLLPAKKLNLTKTIITQSTKIIKTKIIILNFHVSSWLTIWIYEANYLLLLKNHWIKKLKWNSR